MPFQRLIGVLRESLWRSGDNPTSAAGTPTPPPAAPDTHEAPPAGGGFAARLRRFATLREPLSPGESLLLGVACVAGVLLVWHVLTAGVPEARIMSRLTLPSLSETFDGGTLHSLWFDRELMRGALLSLARVGGGFLLAAAIAIPLGVCSGAFSWLNSLLRPLSVFGRNVPVAALIPLSLNWFGIEEMQKVMFIFLACFAFILFDTTNAVLDVPARYLDTAYTLGARFVWRPAVRRAGWLGVVYGAVIAVAWEGYVGGSDVSAVGVVVCAGGIGFFLGMALWFPIFAFQPIAKVLLPGALPDVVNSLRLLFGLAFGYIMLAEVINAEYGLGSIINMSQRRGPNEHIFLCLIFIALLAFAIDRAILSAQAYCFPYRSHDDR